MKNMFDIIIVGGGHSGLEASYIASKFNLKIGLITLKNVPIASSPCNPSIGGVAKGHLVRELDALGGLMPKLADFAGIQYRTLNESKGEALYSTRVQIDKDLYSLKAKQYLLQENIVFIEEKLLEIEYKDNLYELRTDSSSFCAKKLILTTGTFSKGLLHCGVLQEEGGRYNTEATNSLKNLLPFLTQLETKRFKTGTPPRIRKSSINYEFLVEQKSDPFVKNFHFNHSENRLHEQTSCYLTYTNNFTNEIIIKNKEKSPMFNGQIKGVGPRYCPSLEDKVFRYPDKSIHHVFLEPEGIDSDSVYPSGISTSLPKEIQDQIISSIQGLENAEILKYGYAVEYDVINSLDLDKTLEHKTQEGLYFAGQVNGTSGYEEAAVQGHVAGLNAALSCLGLPSVVFSRYDSYIGVLVEDLVSSSRDEPYRLFTSRSENRLFLREDNVYYRMSHYRKKYLLQEDLDIFLENYIFLRNILINSSYFPFEDLKKEKQSIDFLKNFFKNKKIEVSPLLICDLAITGKYEGYLKKQMEDIDRLKSLYEKKIFLEIILKHPGVSFECKERIKKFNPKTFGDLRFIDHLRPSTFTAIASTL